MARRPEDGGPSGGSRRTEGEHRERGENGRERASVEGERRMAENDENEGGEREESLSERGKWVR